MRQAFKCESKRTATAEKRMARQSTTKHPKQSDRAVPSERRAIVFNFELTPPHSSPIPYTLVDLDAPIELWPTSPFYSDEVRP